MQSCTTQLHFSYITGFGLSARLSSDLFNVQNFMK